MKNDPEFPEWPLYAMEVFYDFSYSTDVIQVRTRFKNRLLIQTLPCPSGELDVFRELALYDLRKIVGSHSKYIDKETA